MNKLLYKFTNSNIDIGILRFGVIMIFMLFGTYKWFDFEVRALEPIISNSWLNILYTGLGMHGASYLLGIVETIAFIALIIGYMRPKVGILGDILIIITGVTTLSLLPQLGKIDSFIFKDILLIGAGLVLLKYDLKRSGLVHSPSHTH
ncbi:MULTISPECIES: DUF417 family protein [unclassified Acinetobacter]|uniref:DUF417 family protein n=1 Tax=unclassified Acinetobacter TaxID=196816 RepID=UPI002934A97E|nr:MULTISPECIES: DUF417 family protein [unclassified Acinetobacter]WOE30607.1 DUF417 family protein [Acinetobacter sp. SAAs470]WOE38799.1 DUF417 family protein [Acinetobacter sp. SAAs474]